MSVAEERTLMAVEKMLTELNLRVDLRITKGKLAEYDARAISKASQQ